MTDPTMPRRPMPSLLADPGTLRAIRVEARRRRVRRLQTTGAGTTTLALVAALALVNRGGSTVGLEPVVPPVVVESVSPSAAPSAVVPDVVTPAQPADTISRSTTTVTPSASSAAVAPRVGPSAGAQRPAPSAAPVNESVPRPPVTRSERDSGVQAPCTAGTAVPDWCLAATVDSGSSGERSTLQLAICPTDRTVDQTLSYPRDVETRFVVTQSGRDVWASDDDGGSGPAHAVTVTAGRCVVWSVEWDQTDGAGELVAPGDYDLTATSYAAEVAGAPTSTATFTVGSPAT